MLPLPTISAPIPTYSASPYMNMSHMGPYSNMSVAPPMAPVIPAQMHSVQMAPMAYAAPVAYAQPVYAQQQVAYAAPVSYAPPNSVMMSPEPDLFDRLDVNGDGVLSPEEFANVHRLAYEGAM